MKIALWPDGEWCDLEEGPATEWKSDDYIVVTDETYIDEVSAQIGSDQAINFLIEIRDFE